MIESPEYPRGLWLHVADEAGQALAGIQVDYHGLPNGLVALRCVDPAGLRREMLLWTLPQGDPLRLTLQPREPADLPAGLTPIDWHIAPAAEARLEPVAATRLTGWEPVEAFLRTRWQGRSGRVAVLLYAGTSLAVDLDHPQAVGMLRAYLQQLYQLEGITLGKGTRLNVQVYKGSPTLVEGVTLFIAYFFEDAALEAAVRQQLRRPQGPITRQDVDSLTKLKSASNKAIHSLSGLEHFTALRRLYLGHNPLVDVSFEKLHILEFDAAAALGRKGEDAEAELVRRHLLDQGRVDAAAHDGVVNPARRLLFHDDPLHPLVADPQHQIGDDGPFGQGEFVDPLHHPVGAVGEDLVGAGAGDALVDLHVDGDRGQFEELTAAAADAAVDVADAEGGERSQQGQGELGFHGRILCAGGRMRLVSGLELDTDAPCFQGGDLFGAGLVAEGIISQRQPDGRVGVTFQCRRRSETASRFDELLYLRIAVDI